MPSNGREKWGTNLDFLFITIGAAVGLGNVWRFPYLCYKNGGGAFLIPYFLSLILVSLPHLILQSSLGQYTSRAGPNAWKITPIMKGLGFSSVILLFVANFTYATVLAWSLRYLYACWSKILPWSTCGNWWNTKNCFEIESHHRPNFTLVESGNETMVINETSVRVAAVIEYWKRNVLGISNGLTDINGFRVDVLICLIIVWIISFLCMFKGINWTSKTTYVTVTMPMILLIVLLIRGLTLDGAIDGIRFFLSPDLKQLLKPQVWQDAVLQNIYSLAVGFGSIIALSSFNKYHHNFYRDCIALSVANSFTSILAGLTVFSTLGFMAKQQNTTVETVAESGPGLVFVVYPQAIQLMPGGQFWGTLFFLMLFMLGLDTLFAAIEAEVANISDLFPNVFNRRWKKTLLNFFLSAITCLIGLITVTDAGMYYIYLFDNFSSASWALLLQVACECIAIAWLYGVDVFFEHICEMLQFRPRFPWFKYCWKYIVPAITAVLFIYCLVLYRPLVYNRTYIYPTWSIVIGWCLTLSSVLWIPGYAIYYIIMKKCVKKQEFTLYEISLSDNKEDDEEIRLEPI